MFFFDEGRFGLRSTVTRVWGRRGTSVRVKVKLGFQNFFMYSGVSPLNGNSYTLLMPEVNTDMMNVYLQELSRTYQHTTVLLIMDQAGWHQSKELILPSNIRILHLPPYSPELNPVEKLWWWLRREVTHNTIFATLSELMDAIENKFREITNSFLAQLCHCSYLSNLK